MAYPPHTFSNQSGNVPASQIDDNFAAALEASAAAGTVKANLGGSTAPAVDTTMAALYGALKSVIPWEWAVFVGGTPGNSWQIGRYQPSTALSIAVANCYASSGVAATAATAFNLSQNGSNIGTITFGIGATTGTFSISGSPVSVAVGDKLTITAPATADVTLADINFTIGGKRA